MRAGPRELSRPVIRLLFRAERPRVPIAQLACLRPHETAGVDARPDVVLKRLTDLLVTLDAWATA